MDTPLLIDVGNTRVKWRMGALEGALPVAEVSAQFECAWRELPVPGSVWGVSVGQAGVQEVVAQWVTQEWGCPVHWVQTTSQALGVRNMYAVDQLGADRWVAALGAWSQWSGEVLGVIDAGSAVTVDIITAEGEFAGGSILPGWQMMARALNMDTANIDVSAMPLVYESRLPLDTASAVQAGVQQAWAGGVLQAMVDARENMGADVHWVLTGGDGARLLQLCAQSLPEAVMQYQPDLVMRGLAALAEVR